MRLNMEMLEDNRGGRSVRTALYLHGSIAWPSGGPAAWSEALSEKLVAQEPRTPGAVTRPLANLDVVTPDDLNEGHLASQFGTLGRELPVSASTWVEHREEELLDVPARPEEFEAKVPHVRLAETSARCSSPGRATLLALGVLCLGGCDDHTNPGARGLPRWWLEGSDQTEPPEPPGRQAEVDAYNAQLYAAQGFEVLATTVTAEGQSIDWVADGSMAGFYDTPPPKSKDIPLPKGAERQRTELDEHPELVGPAGTIPVYRNRFEGYVSGESGASSLQDYLDHHQVMGRTDGANRLYAGLRADTANKGAVGWVNAFEGEVEKGTFGLIELAVFCEGANKAQTLEQIGIAASREKANGGDGRLRLHVEFFTAGPGQLGPNKGGWDDRQLGFQAAAGRRYAPGTQLRGSTLGGPQEEARFEIRLFQGRWWVGYNADWLGSYDASLFTLMKTGACSAAWYGEVFDPTPVHWTMTGMGSGHFADQGYGNVSWVSNPALYKDASGFWSSPVVDVGMSPMDPACYTRTALVPRGPGLPPWFFLGGPGGKAAGCK